MHRVDAGRLARPGDDVRSLDLPERRRDRRPSRLPTEHRPRCDVTVERHRRHDVDSSSARTRTPVRICTWVGRDSTRAGDCGCIPVDFHEARLAGLEQPELLVGRRRGAAATGNWITCASTARQRRSSRPAGPGSARSPPRASSASRACRAPRPGGDRYSVTLRPTVASCGRPWTRVMPVGLPERSRQFPSVATSFGWISSSWRKRWPRRPRSRRVGIAVPRRPALQDVRDVHVPAGQADSFEQRVEQLAGRAHERIALLVLVEAWGFRPRT